MKYALAAGLLALLPLSAQARMMDKDMRMPTMKQCHMGYKASYMRTMHWSRASFKKACHHEMMMMKKKAM